MIVFVGLNLDIIERVFAIIAIIVPNQHSVVGLVSSVKFFLLK